METPSLKTVIFTGILIVLIVQVVSYFLIAGLFGFTPKDASSFGDMFGAVNTFFSGLAFAGLIYTILLQSNELKLARIEYEKSSSALQNSSVHMQKQVEMMREQINLSIQDQKARTTIDIIRDMFSDDEIRKFYYKIDYNKFEFNTDKDFLKKFYGSDEERYLDSLLYKYNSIANLINRNYLNIDDVNFMIFPMIRVLDNKSVKCYLEWLESENIKWGNSDYVRFSDLKSVVEKAKVKIENKSIETE